MQLEQKMRRIGAFALMAAMAGAAHAQEVGTARADGSGAARDDGFTVQVPTSLFILFTPTGIPIYGAAPATPRGDTSTFSLPGPAVGRGPEVGIGADVGSGPQLDGDPDALPASQAETRSTTH